MSTLQAGSIVGERYAVLNFVGRGGRARVYKAEDRVTGRIVALKVMRSTLQSRTDELYLEAEVARIVRHDTILRVDECGELLDGQAYLVMEFVDGESLSDVFKRGTMKVTNVLDWAERIATALQQLHSQGILHRDVKPANIVVPFQSGQLAYHQAKLLDMGISVSGAASFVGTLQTRSGLLSGTPLYMAPEQLTGRRQSAATDIFSLGLVLYEALTGILPGKDLQIDHVIRGSERVPRAFLGPFVTFRLTALLTVPPTLPCPPALRHFIDVMLDLDPKQRPNSAGDVVAMVRELRALNQSMSCSKRDDHANVLIEQLDH